MLNWLAQFHQKQGELKDALNYYLDELSFNEFGKMPLWRSTVAPQLIDWASARGQTPEQIKVAIQQIAEWRSARYGTAQAISFVMPHAARKEIGSRVWSDILRFHGAIDSEQLLAFVPWEVERSVRIAEHEATENATHYASLSRLDSSLTESIAIDFPEWMDNRNNLGQLIPKTTHAFARQSRTSVFGSWFGMPYFFMDLELIQSKRYLLMRLALRAHQLKHGQLPDSLESIDPEILKVQPVCVFSGKPFYYAPEGLDHVSFWTTPRFRSVVKSENPNLIADAIGTIGQKRPFLLPWSQQRRLETKNYATVVENPEGIDEGVGYDVSPEHNLYYSRQVILNYELDAGSNSD